MIFFFDSNFVAAILKMANLRVIRQYFSLETVIFAFYGKFPTRIRISPYSTHDVRLDFFTGFVSEMEYQLLDRQREIGVYDNIVIKTENSSAENIARQNIKKNIQRKTTENRKWSDRNTSHIRLLNKCNVAGEDDNNCQLEVEK